MYAVLVVLLHIVVSSPAALAVAPYSLDSAATTASLWILALSSAALSALGLVATASYLSKRIQPLSGALVGFSCGVLCAALMGLVGTGMDFSLVLYLSLLAPALLAVLLAILLDRSKSGWQSRP